MQFRLTKYFVPMLLMGLSFTIFSGCARHVQKQVPIKEEEPKIALHLTNVHPFQMDDKGRKLWEASAKSVLASQTQENMVLQQVHVTLYQDGNPELSLSAPRMKADYTTQKLFLDGGVNIISQKRKARLKTGQLVWNGKTHQFMATKGVSLTRGPIRITGGSLTGDTQLKRVRILDHPKLVANP